MPGGCRVHPDRLTTMQAPTAREITNPIRAQDYVLPERHYRTLSGSLFVRVDDGV